MVAKKRSKPRPAKRPMHKPAEPVSDLCIKRKQRVDRAIKRVVADHGELLQALVDELPEPTTEELASMHLPSAPFGEPVRWICCQQGKTRLLSELAAMPKEERAEVLREMVAESYRLRACSVLARTAFAARALAAVKMGCAPEDVVVGIIDPKGANE